MICVMIVQHYSHREHAWSVGSNRRYARSFVQIDRTGRRLSKQSQPKKKEEREIINRILFLFSFVIHYAAKDKEQRERRCE